MTAITMPTSTDDAGDLTTGTILNEAFFDAIESTINNQVHSANNPTVLPKTITDEVITARGSLSTLDGRLDVEHNNDGTHNLSASIVTTTVLATSIGNQNLAANGTFIMWPDGDTSAPSYFDLSGTGAAILRCGTGLATTTRLIGDFCARVTYGSATARLQQTLIDAARWASLDHLEGTAVSLTTWVFSATVSQVRAYWYSGATAGYEYSSYHTGDSTWQRLEVIETILTTATELTAGVEIAGTGNFFVSGFCPILGATATDKFIPSRVVRGAIVFTIVGTPATGDGQRHYIPSRPMMLTDVQMFLKTAPSGAFTIDIETGDGTTWASVFASVPSIDSGKEFAWQECDSATYANKFAKSAFLDNGDLGAAGADQAVIRLNIDAVNAGADGVICLRGWQFARPLEEWIAYND